MLVVDGDTVPDNTVWAPRSHRAESPSDLEPPSHMNQYIIFQPKRF